MPPRDVFIEALRRLDPAASALADFYVPRATPGSRWSWPWPTKFATLVTAGMRPRVLLQGSIGVGKTSELRRWAEELGKEFTVAFIEDADPTWAEPDRVTQLIHATLRALQAPADLVRVVDKTGSVPQAFDVLSRWCEEHRSGRLVLVIDGLDRVNDLDMERAFGPGTELTSAALPPLVMAAPVALLTLAPNTSRDDGFDTVLHLPAFPVQSVSGEPNEEVVAHLAAGIARRLDGLDLVRDPGLFARVAWSSGGNPRDAVRILRGAVLAALDAPELHDSHVLEGEREVRQDLEQSLREGDPDVLVAVDRDSEYFGDARLVTANAVIAYEGPTRRYFRPHPLLSDVVSLRKHRTPHAGR